MANMWVAVKEGLTKIYNSSGQYCVTNPKLLVDTFNASFVGYPKRQVNGDPNYMTKKFKDLNSVWPGEIKLNS